jgi:hypothetical protein
VSRRLCVFQVRLTRKTDALDVYAMCFADLLVAVLGGSDTRIALAQVLAR